MVPTPTGVPPKAVPNVNVKTSPEVYPPPPFKTVTDETAPVLSVVISKEASPELGP